MNTPTIGSLEDIKRQTSYYQRLAREDGIWVVGLTGGAATAATLGAEAIVNGHASYGIVGLAVAGIAGMLANASYRDMHENHARAADYEQRSQVS